MPSTTSGRNRSRMRRASTTETGTRSGRTTFFHGASRSKPLICTVSRSKPASGTRRSSGPPRRPTSRTAPSGSSSRNACATASAGYRCPPVPPPAIRSLICLTILPQSGTRAVAGDAQQQSDRRQRGRHRGAAVAEKGQRHARDGERVGHGRHVEQRLEGDPRGDGGGQGHAKGVGRAERGAVAAHPEEQEAEHDQRGAEKPCLLPDYGEDEVRVRLRQPAVLLDRVPDADAEETARGETVQRLRGLKSRAERIRPRILERREPGESVRLEQGDRQESEPEQAGEQDHVAHPPAAGPVGADEDADHDECGAHVLLQHEQDQDAGQHGREGDERLLEVAHPPGVAIDPVGDEDGERQLAELGGLEGAERPGVEPPPRAVDAHPEVRHEYQQHEQRRRHRAGGSQRPKLAVVDAPQHEEREKAEQHPRCLTLRVVEGRLVLRVRERDAGARHHDEAAAAQQHGCEQQDAVRLRLGPGQGAHAAKRSRTRALNWLPRSSKSLNMSKLLYAGLSRTTPPRRTRPAACRTASSRFSARTTFGCARSSTASAPADAPISTTASAFASTSATHSRRSNPVPYPPAISTTGAPGNARRATRPASGLVAFESLYQRTPAHSPTSSMRCSTPLKPRIAALIAASLRPAIRPTAAAASAFSMLCCPGSGIGGGGWCLSNHTIFAFVRDASPRTVPSRLFRTA